MRMRHFIQIIDVDAFCCLPLTLSRMRDGVPGQSRNQTFNNVGLEIGIELNGCVLQNINNN